MTGCDFCIFTRPSWLSGTWITTSPRRGEKLQLQHQQQQRHPRKVLNPQPRRTLTNLFVFCYRFLKCLHVEGLSHRWPIGVSTKTSSSTITLTGSGRSSSVPSRRGRERPDPNIHTGPPGAEQDPPIPGCGSALYVFLARPFQRRRSHSARPGSRVSVFSSPIVNTSSPALVIHASPIAPLPPSPQLLPASPQSPVPLASIPCDPASSTPAILQMPFVVSSSVPDIEPRLPPSPQPLPALPQPPVPSASIPHDPALSTPAILQMPLVACSRIPEIELQEERYSGSHHRPALSLLLIEGICTGTPPGGKP